MNNQSQSAYYGALKWYPLLPKEETDRLVRIAIADSQYNAAGDIVSGGPEAKKARKKLVEANLRLVLRVAHQYQKRNARRSMEDMIQDGNMGLMRAVEKFRLDKGCELSTYACWWINSAILRGILDHFNAIKVGYSRGERALFWNLRKEQAALSAQGFDPTPERIAQRMHVRPEEVVAMDIRLRGDLSIDRPVCKDDDSGALVDTIADDKPDVETQTSDAQESARIHREFEKFSKTIKNERDRYIFDKRLLSRDPVCLQEIGDRFGFTRERARQIEAALMKRVTKHMRMAFPEQG